MNGIVIVGGGFAGLWATLVAVRELDAAGRDIPVTLISKDTHLTLRPRLYEARPERFRTPLEPLLETVGARFLHGEVANIDTDRRQVSLASDAGIRGYDRLVLATGSEQVPLPVPGADQAFDIDTWEGAMRLDRHLAARREAPNATGRDDVVVIGAGFTGIEIAAEFRDRITGHAGAECARRARIVLLDRAEMLGPELGAAPRPVIEAALAEMGIEVRLGVTIRAIDARGVTLEEGARIDAQTVIIAAGLRASPLAKLLPGTHDALGRLIVDESLRVPGLPEVFATGDVARAVVDEAGNNALMSCQHAMTMGRYAGYNAAHDLMRLDLEPYRQERYVTCLDLGAAGAVFTRGWDREVELTGEAAKSHKRKINGEIIYPPSGDRETILAAATLVPAHHRSPPEKQVGQDK